jgi:hypothetical protein
MPEYQGNYLFIKNVRIGDELSSEMLGYDTPRAAEIKFHDEVSYGLKLDSITLAHYMVINEYGVVIENLERTIDNQPPVEPEI